MKNIYVLGINYKQSSIEIRNKFALGNNELEKIYQDPGLKGISFFVLSTCNRTEVYSTGKDSSYLLGVLKKYTKATDIEIEDNIFIKKNINAINHLFRVTAGLDSQILGDYEIVSQIKKAFMLAKENNCVDGYLEKIMNSALQASKEVRTKTKISDGTSSVSYAVIKAVKSFFKEDISRSICLLGLGKIGSSTVENLRSYLPHHNITIVNRNEQKAIDLSKKFQTGYAPLERQFQTVAETEILIVATGAQEPIIKKSDLEGTKVKLVIDLSVPSNVDKSVATLPNVTLYDIDTLSQKVNKTLMNRQNEIPMAMEIIDKHTEELIEWGMRNMEFTVCNSCNINNHCNILNGHRNWYAEQSACVMAS